MSFFAINLSRLGKLGCFEPTLHAGYTIVPSNNGAVNVSLPACLIHALLYGCFAKNVSTSLTATASEIRERRLPSASTSKTQVPYLVLERKIGYCTRTRSMGPIRRYKRRRHQMVREGQTSDATVQGFSEVHVGMGYHIAFHSRARLKARSWVGVEGRGTERALLKFWQWNHPRSYWHLHSMFC
ncbi:hypothetical protein ARMSODRAFT_978319 [Armillaria solidipes]|uniref:Uncharacterized protein n=1 Tax=Armillaria solidipes TaxID=1076256 RepID=A0A2H3B3U5_9AGAR|nr:hypothetical protein ARMSODRAFT_978319 [Armillaria solidipes]